jgi:plastocyanin
MRKPIALVAAAGLAAALATPALGAGATVRVGDDFFRAKTVRITKGSTVTWRWAGSDRHDVVFRGFKSKLQNKGTYKHKFAKAGTFRYVCSLHSDSGMKGTVVVR